jgi:hypothetical protein
MTNQLTARLSKLNMDELVEIVNRAYADNRDEAGLVLDAALSILQSRLPEPDFIRFCSKF